MGARPATRPEFVVLVIGRWPLLKQLVATRHGSDDGPLIVNAADDLSSVRVQAASCRPAWLVFADFDNEVDLIGFAPSVLEVAPSALTAVLGPEGDLERWRRWVRRGARVYLTADVTPARLISTLRAASDLKVTICDERLTTEAGRQDVLLKATGIPMSARLTPREVEVLRILKGGFSNADIATLLHLSKSTVEFHMTHILDKLHARNRTQAAQRASLLDL